MDAGDWDRRYAAEDLVWSVGPNRFVAEELTGLTPGRALDLAAGEGRNALWLAEQGWQVDAVDWSAVGLDKARRAAAARGVELTLLQADVTAHQPEPGGYDLALLSYLQLPASQLRTVLRTALAAVRTGGLLLLVAHDLRNLTEGSGGPQDPDVLTTPEAVAGIWSEGARIERAETVRREVNPHAGHGGEPGRPALDTLVRAVRT